MAEMMFRDNHWAVTMRERAWPTKTAVDFQAWGSGAKLNSLIKSYANQSSLQCLSGPVMLTHEVVEPEWDPLMLTFIASLHPRFKVVELVDKVVRKPDQLAMFERTGQHYTNRFTLR